MVHRRRTELVQMTEAAVAVALSVLLGNLRLVELPNGGSIALAVIPLLALALARGARTALLACSCAGAAHALSGGTIIHPAQLALDYLLAYAVLALAGLASSRARHRLAVSGAICAAMLLHGAAMVASGVIFFAPVAGSAAVAYSVAYNAATVIPELLLALWLTPPLVRALARANPADSWRRGLLDPPRLQRRWARTIDAPMPIDTQQSGPAVSRQPAPIKRPAFVRRAPFAQHAGLVEEPALLRREARRLGTVSYAQLAEDLRRRASHGST